MNPFMHWLVLTGILLGLFSSEVLPAPAAKKGGKISFHLHNTLIGPSHSAVLSVVFNKHDSRQLITGLANGTILIWDITSNQVVVSFKAHDRPVTTLGISTEGLLISGSREEKYALKLWRIPEGVPLLSLAVSQISSSSLSEEGHIVAAGSWNNDVTLYNLPEGQPFYTLKGKRKQFFNLLKSGQGHHNSVQAVAISADGTQLATGGFDQQVRLWELSNGQPLLPNKEKPSWGKHEDWVLAVAFSPQGQLLASSSYDRTLKSWNLKSGEVKSVQAHAQAISCLAFHPTLNLLVSGSFDNTIELWESTQLGSLGSLTGHSDYINAVDFNADGSLLASASGDGTVKLWKQDDQDRP